MKTKLLVFISSVLFSFLQVNAQLKVNSNGKVGIGTSNPQLGLLQIGKSGVDNGIAIYDSLKSLPPLKFYTSGNCGFLNFGGLPEKGMIMTSDGHIGLGSNSLYGTSLSHYINVFVSRSNPCAALVAQTDYPFDYGVVIGVRSNKNTDVAYSVRDISNGQNNFTYTVYGDGTIYSKGDYLTASDAVFKDNISEIDNSLDIVKKIQGVTYTMKNQESTTDGISRNSILLDESSSAQSPVPAEIANKIKAEKKRKKVGFIAQELEKIFPDVVYTTIDGTKAIAYSEIIPLLVEAIKEQQVQIEALQQGKNTKTRAMEESNDLSEETSSMDQREQAALFSNIPNPFKEETTISFFIPTGVSKASLHIYNLQGKQIKQIILSDRGRSSVILKGHELNPGMYMYTLIADGKEVDTKKMILTD